MSSLKTIMAGCVLAGGLGLAGPSPVRAAWQELPLQRGGEGMQASPASVCSAFSLAKRYDLADPDFLQVRDQLNAMLAAAKPGREGRLEKAARHRIAPDARRFGLRLEHSQCGQVHGPLEAALSVAGRGGVAKECLVPDCTEPVPGWRAPEGSTLALWTCEHNIFRQVVYERVNGTWVAVSVEEEQVATCELIKDPVDDDLDGDGKG